MAAWDLIAGKRRDKRSSISFGNGGGGAAGYNFSVQSYWPPRVHQRRDLLRNFVIDKGLWTDESFGGKETFEVGG